MKSLLATVTSFVADLLLWLLWSFFMGGLAASTTSGAVRSGRHRHRTSSTSEAKK